MVQEEGPVDVHASLLQHVHPLTVGLVATGNQVEQLQHTDTSIGQVVKEVWWGRYTDRRYVCVMKSSLPSYVTLDEVGM